MDTENMLLACQLEQCADIYTSSYSAQGCLKQTLPSQDQHNIIHIEQYFPQQVTCKCYSIWLSKPEFGFFWQNKSQRAMKDDIFHMGYFQLSEKQRFNALIPERNENRRGQKVFHCHSITYSKLLAYK